MINFIKSGENLTVAAPYALSSGDGCLVGSLFGVASADAVLAADVEIVTEGEFDMKKTPALAIGAGDVLYWDDVTKVLNKTASGVAVAVATVAAANPSATVRCRLGSPAISGGSGVADGSITNAKLAAIVRGSIRVGAVGNVASDLDAKTAGQILVGNGSDVVSVAVTGDVTLSAAGVTSLKTYVPPSVWYPSGIPGSFAGGSPSIGDCAALIAALAPLVAMYAIQTSKVLPIVQKAATDAQSGSVSIGGVSGNLAALTAATEAVPVGVVAASAILVKDLAFRLGLVVGRVVDAAILATYASLTTRTPVGTGGFALTAANLDTALSYLVGRGEPPLFILHAPLYGGFNSGINYYKQARVILSDQVKLTGAAPATTNNVGCVPSTFGFASSNQALTNDATHAQALSVSDSLSVVLSITNTGSGVQTISAQVTGVAIVLDAGANAVQLRS